MLNQLARYLQISENLIKDWEQWDHVIFVRFIKGRPTFVSKKKFFQAQIKVIEPCPWTLEAQMRRQEGKKWVARIDGTSNEKAFGFLKRTFLSAQSVEWGKYGMRKAVFSILEPGFYQDSDGDFFKAVIDNGKIDCANCSKMEVQAHFGLVKV